MPYSVKVTSAPEKKTTSNDKGEYDYTSMMVEYQGKEIEKKIFPGTFKKYPNLKSELDKVKNGMTIQLTTVQNGKFTEISKVEVVNNTEGRPSSNKKEEYDPNGAQVGNALNVSAITLGAGCTVDQIIKRAWDVICAGEQLKTRLKNGDHLKVNQEPGHDPSMDQGYTQEDVPF